MNDLDPSVTEWASRFAEALGGAPPTPEEVDGILQLAAIAAHASQRQAAPITCWLAARSGVSVQDALDVATRLQ
jgi:hypothetical protein